jgi:putative DNA primase/helicase
MNYETPELTFQNLILDADVFMEEELPEKLTILDPWLSIETITLISGFRGSGKSWLGLSLVDAITKGLPLGPWKTITPLDCLYLDGEMHLSDLQKRLRSFPKAPRKSRFAFYSDAFASYSNISWANLLDPFWRKQAEDALLAEKIKLFVLDNIASLSSGLDENSKQEWDPINKWLLNLRFKGISTILIHHFNKQGGQRGTSAREDNIDNSLVLKPPPNYIPESGCNFILEFSKVRDRAKPQPLEFKAQTDSAGCFTWTWRPLQRTHEISVLQGLSDGVKQADIAEMLELSPGRVTQIKHQLEKDGYVAGKTLTSKGVEHLKNYGS